MGTKLDLIIKSMFLCRSCQTAQQSHEISINLSKRSTSTISTNPNSTNSLIIKDSLYNKYLSKNKPFTDPEFPPNSDSLSFQPLGRQTAWKRISEIVPNFVLFQRGIQEADVQMENLDDLYFLPTIAAIAKQPNRIRTIFFHLTPEANRLGIYCLLVKDKGVIKELVIDDFVPIYRDTGRPIFCKANGKEIWVMLIEKAWAKLKGSYGAMKFGCPHQVLTSFCIGPCLSYELNHKSLKLQEKVWKDLRYAFQNRYVVCVTSSISPINNGIVNRRIFSLLGLSLENNIPQIKLHNYWSKQQILDHLKTIKIQSKKDQSSIIYSPTRKTVATQLRAEKQEIIFTLSDFLANFDRIDISHENGSFDYEFKELQFSQFPIFLEFLVQKDHQAYICVTKPRPQNVNPFFIRLLLASSNQQGKYRIQGASSDTLFSDCFIHLKSLKIGKHVLMIDAEFGYNNPKELILSYYSKGLSSRSTSINQLAPSQLSLHTYLDSIFLDHSQTEEGSILYDQNDLIRCGNLFEQCGFGYVVCRVPRKANFRLAVDMDHSQIKASGLKLLGQWGERENIMPDEKQVFVFQLVSVELESDFPPKGFRVSKII